MVELVPHSPHEEGEEYEEEEEEEVALLTRGFHDAHSWWRDSVLIDLKVT